MLSRDLVIDVFDEAFQRDPYPVFRAARQRGRTARDTFGSIILLHIKDFEYIAADKRFGAFGDRLPRMLGATSGPTYDWLARCVMFLDPPDHTRLRGLVRREFTARRLSVLHGQIAQTTDMLLDAVAAAGEMNVIEDFAAQLPLITICQLIGMPAADAPLLRRWSDHLLANNAQEIPRADQAISEFRDYLTDLIGQRRRHPGDDLVSALTVAERNDQLCQDELWNLLMKLVFAGNDTTMGLLANSVYLLLCHPEQLAALIEQPAARVAAAVEEFLRFEPPVSGNGRIALTDVEFGDLTVSAGQALRLMPTAVNRDPERFTEPDVFDITRSPNRHVAFGYGVHLCLGAMLARMEAQIAIPKVVGRLRNMRLATPAVRWAATRGRTLESLHITFDAQ
jgi:cytochrome P450